MKGRKFNFQKAIPKFLINRPQGFEFFSLKKENSLKYFTAILPHEQAKKKKKKKKKTIEGVERKTTYNYRHKNFGAFPNLDLVSKKREFPKIQGRSLL